MTFYVYILISEQDGSLYAGQTAHLPERIHRHNHGLVRAARSRVPFRLAYFETFESRAEAMWRDWELKKRWNTERKKRLIQGFDRSRIAQVLGL